MARQYQLDVGTFVLETNDYEFQIDGETFLCETVATGAVSTAKPVISAGRTDFGPIGLDSPVIRA